MGYLVGMNPCTDRCNFGGCDCLKCDSRTKVRPAARLAVDTGVPNFRSVRQSTDPSTRPVRLRMPIGLRRNGRKRTRECVTPFILLIFASVNHQTGDHIFMLVPLACEQVKDVRANKAEDLLRQSFCGDASTVARRRATSPSVRSQGMSATRTLSSPSRVDQP